MGKRAGLAIESTRILLVEEDAGDAGSRRDALETVSFHCSIAHSVSEACGKLTGDRTFSLIILDIDLLNIMDEMTRAGWEQSSWHLPIVALMRDENNAPISHYIEPPYYGFILKSAPVRITEGAVRMALRLHQASSTIENKEAHILSLFKAVPVGICLLQDRIIIECNDHFLKLYGYSRDEVIGQSTRRFYEDEETYNTSGADFQDQLRTRGEAHMEAILHRKDGSPRIALFRGTAFNETIPTPSGERSVQLVSLAILDITEQKDAERVLKARIDSLTSPINLSNTDVHFTDLFDMENIQKIQDAFAVATGVASIITDENGVPLTQPSNFTHLCNDIIRKTQQGCINCMKSDRVLGCQNEGGPLISPCLSGGLWDGGASITIGRKHIGNWLIGQVVDEDADIEKLRQYAKVIGADQVEYDRALAAVPRMKKEHFVEICDALYLIAGQLSNLAFSNIQQARAITEKQKAELEKDALYRELKHRVKNGMAMIAGLVSLESSRHPEESTRLALDATRARIESLATLYDLLGGSSDPNELRIDEYLGRIAQVVESTFAQVAGKVSFKLDLQPLYIEPRSAAPLGLILMELLTNTLKYAFPDKRPGIVLVILRLTAQGMLELAVKDNGVGLPDGFSPEQSSGLGMELIQMLVMQLDAKFSYRSENGAVFLVSLGGTNVKPA